MANVPDSLLPQRDNTKLGVWFFLGSEVVFFTALIMTFEIVNLRDPQALATFRHSLSVPLIGLNTFILITSSYFVVRALEAIEHDSRKGLMGNLLAVFVLGALFVGGQAFEWSTLFRDGVSVRDTIGGPFFTITGFHGTHVIVGLIWLLYVLWGVRKGTFSAQDHRGVEIFGLYWHFVDIVWIVLFTLFYLI